MDHSSSQVDVLSPRPPMAVAVIVAEAVVVTSAELGCCERCARAVARLIVCVGMAVTMAVIVAVTMLSVLLIVLLIVAVRRPVAELKDSAEE